MDEKIEILCYFYIYQMLINHLQVYYQMLHYSILIHHIHNMVHQVQVVAFLIVIVMVMIVMICDYLVCKLHVVSMLYEQPSLLCVILFSSSLVGRSNDNFSCMKHIYRMAPPTLANKTNGSIHSISGPGPLC